MSSLWLLPLAVAAMAHPAPPPRPPLVGTWKTACMPIGKNGRHGMITTLTATAETLTAASQVYARASCDTPTIRTTYRATITALDERGGGFDLDHVVEAIEMTIDSADVIEVYNKPGSGCGFGGGWQRGVTRAVAGRTCAPFAFPAAGTRLYERIWIEENRLRLGSFPIVWANTSPERRPANPGGMIFERVESRALSSPSHSAHAS